MSRKPPTGARHEGCRTHIAHDYLKSGWACVSTYSPADVVAFADDLAAVAMAHRVAELARPRPDAATDPLYTAETRPGTDSNGRIVPGTVTLLAPACHEQNGSSHWSASVHVHPSAAGFSAQHLPYDSTADRESRASLAAAFAARHAPDTYAAAVARVKAPEPVQPEPAPAPEPEPVQPEPVSIAPEPEPEPEPEPARSHGHIGWTWTIEGALSEVYTNGPAIIRAPVHNAMAGNSRIGREWWPSGPAFAPMWRPFTFDTIADALASSETLPGEPTDAPEPVKVAPVQVAPDALTLCNACELAPATPDSPAGYCADCERNAREPEPVNIAPEPAPILAALPAITPDGRPTCERCGQVFRKHGAGADWHRVNRTDCAGARPALTIAS